MAALRPGSGAGGAGTTLACPLLVCPEPSVGAGSPWEEARQAVSKQRSIIRIIIIMY